MKKLLLLFVLSLAFANCSTNDEMEEYQETLEEVTYEEDYAEEQEVFEDPPLSVDEVVQEYDEPDGWSEEFKKIFMSSCTGGIKSSDAPISDSDIRKICECEIEKISKEYPNPNVQFDPQIIMKLEEKCGREVLGW
jgi:hypothetical protein